MTRVDDKTFWEVLDSVVTGLRRWTSQERYEEAGAAVAKEGWTVGP